MKHKIENSQSTFDFERTRRGHAGVTRKRRKYFVEKLLDYRNQNQHSSQHLGNRTGSLSSEHLSEVVHYIHKLIPPVLVRKSPLPSSHDKPLRIKKPTTTTTITVYQVKVKGEACNRTKCQSLSRFLQHEATRNISFCLDEGLHGVVAIQKCKILSSWL